MSEENTHLYRKENTFSWVVIDWFKILFPVVIVVVGGSIAYGNLSSIVQRNSELLKSGIVNRTEIRDMITTLSPYVVDRGSVIQKLENLEKDMVWMRAAMFDNQRVLSRVEAKVDSKDKVTER